MDFKDLEKVFTSPNESDSNLEVANVVDGLFFIGRAIHKLSESILVASNKAEEMAILFFEG